MPKIKTEKNKGEKPTPEQLKKVKKSPKPEKKEKWRYPIEPEEKEDFSTGSPIQGTKTEEKEAEEEDSLYLEEICGNLWAVLYQLGGILKKGFEPLTEDTKNLLAPPSARIALKYHVETYMKDEFLLLGILGIDISRRLIVKKKEDKDSEEVERK